MKIYVYLFIIIFSLSIPIKAGELKEKSVIPYRVWDSDTCNIGQAEVWFQNWVDYTRLFIKSIKDTSIINKHPYAKTDFKKSYLNAKDFTKLNYVQLLGNIKWFENQNWSDGKINQFEWHIDRDQNWYYKNKKLIGSAKIQSDTLYLVIKDYNQTIIELKAKARKFK